MDAPVTATPPPLTRWQSTWRYLLAVVFGGALWATLLPMHGDVLTDVLAVDLALGCAAVVLMRWRRRHPLATATAATLLSVASTAAAGATGVITVSLATRRRWREIVPVAVLGVAVSMVNVTLVQPDANDPLAVSFGFTIVITVALVAAGMYIGARRDLLATLQERADRAEREQGMRVDQARATERARIAREMHDVLAHRLSLVAMHAGALAYRRDLGEAELAAASDVIRSNAHRALTDLREILGVLRTPGADDRPEAPQPTLDEVGQLVSEVSAAGTQVRLRNEVGDLAAAPAAVGRSAYRVVQESLTNARKHAPDTTVDIRLSGGAGTDLVVEVRNPVRLGVRVPAAPGAGLGLVGLTERAELLGGQLEHRMEHGQFVVLARLPWPG